MTQKIIIYLLLFQISFEISSAQEVVSGLWSNYQITSAGINRIHTKSMAPFDTIDLPFFDDFSDQQVFPDSKYWLDDFVFINNTYSDKQITTGIATFDAIDNSGRLYETANSSGFEADKLTSVPINLSYDPSENVWFSFFYQAGGLGDPPEPSDSLILQFLAPEENQWYSIWKVKGESDQGFKPVILRIDTTIFLKKGFQFRFINYASLSSNLNDPSMVGNCDHWNIDYVLLDKNRNGGDTVFADVAFRLPIRSLLKRHEALPWKQFRKVYLQEMGATIPIHYRNNDTIIRNVTRNFEIWDIYRNTMSHSFSSGASNIGPLTNVDYNANLVYTFDTNNNDSALFRITAILKTDEFDPKRNDTLVYFQNFKNFFAFDDGSAEAGYGINGLGSRNAMFAYRFESFMQDTIRAIKICFNDSYMQSNKRAFDLMIWDDNNNFPGNVLYSVEDVMVEQDQMINGFYTYRIPEGIMVDAVFYVGWKQRSETFLNAGLDVNTLNEGKQFYWINGDWFQSQVQGSVMIRPVVGDPLIITSINDVPFRDKNLFSIWPNPASDYINIDPGEFQNTGVLYITIMDLYGRELRRIPFSNRIDISFLQAGIYIISTNLNGRPIGHNRLIKTR